MRLGNNPDPDHLSLIGGDGLASLLHYASKAPNKQIAEIGVYRGGSAKVLSRIADALFLFDTFAGMPVSGPLDSHKVGAFSDTSLELVKRLIPWAQCFPGKFPDTLKDADFRPGLFGFVHADVDQYESTKAVIEHMPQYMAPGGMILFDDFMVSGCEGCTQAVSESFRHILITEVGKALVIF